MNVLDDLKVEKQLHLLHLHGLLQLGQVLQLLLYSTEVVKIYGLEQFSLQPLFNTAAES
jgi:hypothetical protein